ncbi:hypothetical protein TNCV_357311 [Trichonephila clavipes]|nr:hypothetical protein TNCV_357311 [Trichonephila clavipes]
MGISPWDVSRYGPRTSRKESLLRSQLGLNKDKIRIILVTKCYSCTYLQKVGILNYMATGNKGKTAFVVSETTVGKDYEMLAQIGTISEGLQCF